MNKSTPLNQLPAGPIGQNAFVNEQQRQIVTNAQAAINTLQMPQNTQQTYDVGNDEEAEIQEALNDVNVQLHRQNMPPPPPVMPQMHPQMQMQQMPSPQMHMQGMPNIPIENQSDMMFMHNMMPSPAMQQPAANGMPFDFGEPAGIKQIIVRFADDLKLGLAIFAVIFALHFVPIETIVGKYFAIEKIPHHQILIRAVLAAIVVIIVKNIILNKIV